MLKLHTQHKGHGSNETSHCSVLFYLLYVRYCSMFKCFYINTSVCPLHLIQSVNITELSPVWESVAESAYRL